MPSDQLTTTSPSSPAAPAARPRPMLVFAGTGGRARRRGDTAQDRIARASLALGRR